MLHPALGHTEGKERSATIDRDVDALVPGERVGVGCDRVVERPILRSQQPAATHACRDRRRTREPPRVPLVPVEKFDRLVTPPELDQRLDLIGDQADRGRLGEPFPPRERDSRLQPRERGIRSAEHELHVPEGFPRDELGRATAGLRRTRESLGRSLPGSFGIPEVRFHQAFEGEVVGEERLLPGLLRCLLPIAGSSTGAPELTQEALDPAEQDENIRWRAFVAELV